MKVHHIGYAVRDIENAVQVFERLGFTAGEITDDLSRNVRIVFLQNGAECIELIAPLADPNPIKDILKKVGPTPYHICYEVEDLIDAINRAKRDGFLVIKTPEAAPAIGGKNVAFLWNKDIGLVELLSE